MARIYDAITVILRRVSVTIFADNIKIVTKFTKTFFKESTELKELEVMYGK